MSSFKITTKPDSTGVEHFDIQTWPKCNREKNIVVLASGPSPHFIKFGKTIKITPSKYSKYKFVKYPSHEDSLALEYDSEDCTGCCNNVCNFQNSAESHNDEYDSDDCASRYGCLDFLYTTDEDCNSTD